MRCDEIIRLCRELAPEELACDWDNPGLLAGRSDREVEKILLAVDVTDEVINQAAEWGADMIISHHPLIFRGIKKVNDTDFVGRRILRLIQKDISCYAMHTNFDAAPGCMADRAAEMLGLSDTKVLEVLGSLADGKPYGIGLSGSLPEEMTLMELARRVKETFNIPHVSVFGDLDSGKKLKCAAICPGSGGSEIELARICEERAFLGVPLGGDSLAVPVVRGVYVVSNLDWIPIRVKSREKAFPDKSFPPKRVSPEMASKGQVEPAKRELSGSPGFAFYQMGIIIIAVFVSHLNLAGLSMGEIIVKVVLHPGGRG